MQFECKKGQLTWKGKINIFRCNKDFIEFEICSMGKTFHTFIGKNHYGNRYISITNWNISMQITSFTDMICNADKLSKQIDEIYAETIAKAVFKVIQTGEFKC